MSGPMAHVDYVSDNGNTYNILLNSAEAALMGGVIPAVSTLNKPSGLVPRYILAQHPTTGRERKIKCPNPTDAHWVGGTVTVSLPQMGSATAVVYNIRGRVGEKRYFRG